MGYLCLPKPLDISLHDKRIQIILKILTIQCSQNSHRSIKISRVSHAGYISLGNCDYIPHGRFPGFQLKPTGPY